MLNTLPFNHKSSFLESYRLPVLSFEHTSKSAASTNSIWSSLQSQETDPRIRSLRLILSKKDSADDNETISLQVALADAMWKAGKSSNAMKMVQKALKLRPDQWMANRIYIDILMAQQAYNQAYDLVLSLKELPPAASWDQELKPEDIELCAASCAWRLKKWEEVAEHLKAAFPKGVKLMPRGLQEDWFRLALYRHKPQDAADAAALLVSSNSLEFTDAILQTLVQRGWTNHALPLYKNIYEQAPRNQLLRRRLVALCIKEGELEEARRLAKPGALDLNL